MDVIFDDMPEKPTAGRLVGVLAGTLIGASIAGPLGAIVLTNVLANNWSRLRAQRD